MNGPWLIFAILIAALIVWRILLWGDPDKPYRGKKWWD